MGFDVNTIKLLIYAKNNNIDFSVSATIGRQNLHLTKKEFSKCLTSFGYKISDEIVANVFEGGDGYAEQFLHYLGAKVVESFDCSDYENATHIHDLNIPLSNKYKNKYTVVIDGGSLEHVFNFPVALKSCMELVQVGGHYIGITPSNNWVGHGFYQISPELYFRAFCHQNGYEIVDVIVYEESSSSRWYKVNDPQKIHGRVILANNKRTYVIIIAKKIACCDIFSSPPQQSDYVEAWSNTDKQITHGQKTFLKSAKDFVPEKIKNKIRKIFFSPYDKKYFTRLRVP